MNPSVMKNPKMMLLQHQAKATKRFKLAQQKTQVNLQMVAYKPGCKS
uniref:Uncharacterized protein n=1 Tax=Fusarium oxysporum (strain Fo5176) TaxID=660025 RepID=A0A0D2YBH4_FUSOF